MSHMNELCHVWIRHITCEWVMAHTNESSHVRERTMTINIFTTLLGVWTSERVMLRMNESWHTCMSQVTYEWVVSHMNESWHIWMGHVQCASVPSPSTSLLQARASQECLCAMMSYVVSCYLCAMTHPYVTRHDTRYVTRHDTRSFVQCVPWLIHAWHECHVTYEWVMAHMHESCHIWMSHGTHEWVMSHARECTITINIFTTSPGVPGMFNVTTCTRMHSHATRVPGLPIRDCAGSSKNLAQMCPKLSAIDMTGKTFFERLYLVPGLGTFGPGVNCPCAPTPPHFNWQLFLDFYEWMAHHFFSSTIHQVIWPSPGTLQTTPRRVPARYSGRWDSKCWIK